MTEAVVRVAGTADRAEVAALLGRAFQVEPAYQWLFPEPSLRARRLGLLIGTLVRHLHAGFGTVEVATEGEKIVGAAVWDRPGAHDPPPYRLLLALPGLLRAVGPRLPKLATLGGKLDAARPEEPHWYLSHLGADPDRQSRGVGKTLLAGMLSRCDAAELPAYLECKQDLVSYYARFGFEVRREVVIDDELTMTTMWREPVAR